MYVVAGESLVDLVTRPDGHFFPAPGGAPFNFARALALQGVPTAYLNALSTDAHGRMLGATLRAAGAVALGPTVSAPTSLAVVACDERGQPDYRFHRDGVADRAVPMAALVARIPDTVLGFHTGGLALVPPDGAGIVTALRQLRARGLVCTLDVNARPAVIASLGVAPADYRDAVLAACALAQVVKVSDEDLRHLGLPDDGPRAARTFLEGGSGLVVITRGDAGAEAIGNGLHLPQPAIAVEVADSVGAGDCFFAGFVAHLLRHGALRAVAQGQGDAAAIARALRHATACAAIDLQRTGCQPATWDEAVVLAARPPARVSRGGRSRWRPA